MLKDYNIKDKLLWPVGLLLLVVACFLPGVFLIEESRHLSHWLLIIGVVSILTLILVIYSLTRHIVKPLQNLVEVSTSLAEGDFERRFDIKAGDEFGTAADCINRAFDIVIDKMFWYEGMLDAIPFPIMVTDLNLRWTFINRAAEPMLGVRRSAVYGEHCAGPHSDVWDTEYSIQRLKGGNTSYTFHHALTDRHYQVDTAWLHDSKGSKTGHIQIIQDISEATRLRRKAEHRNWLRSGEAELGHLMRGEANIPELSNSIITFLCKYINGFGGAFYVARNGDQALELTAAYALTRRKGIADRFAFGEGLVGQAALEKEPILVTRVPADYIQIDSGLGAGAPRNIAVVPFLFEDQIKGVVEVAAFHDFSPREMEFLETAVKHIGVAVNTALSRSQMKKLLDQTRSQAEKLRIQQEEVRQTNEELEAQTRALRASESNLQAQQEELRVTNEELEERTKALEKQRDDIRRKNMALKEAHEENERKARDLEIASRYKSEFMANISHELRTPLNSILILSQLLSQNKEDTLSDKQMEFAQTIHSSGSDLLSLINEILDLSKVEAGKLEIMVEEMSLAELTEDIRRTFEPMARQRNLSFDIEAAGQKVPEYLQTDGKRVWQVMKNLLSNAFKFTETGSIRVDIRRPTPDTRFKNPDLDTNHTLALAVTDTGIGIPPDKQEMIFNAFQQADGTTSRKYGGTGLGLSISKEFARFLGGEIQVESTLGEGSTFTFFLPEDPTRALENQKADKPIPGPIDVPVKTSPAADPSKESNAEEPSFVKDDRRTLRRGDKTLLIIEDDPNFCRILLDLGRERGFKVLIAEDGETGLHFADFFSPDAVILDISLPGIDGWKVMARLKENPKTRPIPVHFVSVSDRPLDALRMGAVGFLTKPVSMEMMEDAFTRIEQVISRPVKRLLVVEDDDAQKRSIVELIGNGDVETQTAATGAEAFDRLQQETYDCVILDLGLGDMSGFELLSRIRKDERISRIPIIIYTGRDLSREEEAELRKFADSIIIKGARSPERLLDETTLFLHRVETRMDDESSGTPSPPSPPNDVLKDKTIMIVDDDMRNVFAIGSVLEERGARLLEARDGLECLRMLASHPDTDLVIMDIMMPEMDGYEAMGRIREQKRFARLPIIALTAKAMKGDKQKCIQAGANDYLAKPVDVDKLISILRVWLY